MVGRCGLVRIARVALWLVLWGVVGMGRKGCAVAFICLPLSDGSTGVLRCMFSIIVARSSV